MSAITHIFGRVGTKEVREHDGRKYASLSVAVDDSYKNKDGEKVEVTDWLPVEITRDSTATFAEKYLDKGQEVYIVAQVKERKFEVEGQKRTKIEFVVGAPGTNIKPVFKGEGAAEAADNEAAQAFN